MKHRGVGKIKGETMHIQIALLLINTRRFASGLDTLSRPGEMAHSVIQRPFEAIERVMELITKQETTGGIK